METSEQAEKRRMRNGIMSFAAVLLVAAAVGVAYNDRPSQSTTSSAASNQDTPTSVAAELKPESIYTTLPNNIACPTEELLLEAINHANAGERTLLEHMLLQNGGPCMVFPAGAQVRVLSVDRSQSASHAIIRFNLAGTPNAEGGWAIDLLVLKP